MGEVRRGERGRRGTHGRVVELFAGVGGLPPRPRALRLATVWANQWEPSTKAQHAFDCYRDALRPGRHAGERGHRRGASEPSVPAHDLLVGGFPCQDYSVAKTLSQARRHRGQEGRPLVAIYRHPREKRPRLVFLENVDRLLKSPASQRGRDFAIILACLSDLGYLVEWRVVNAADYGFPQRRRRVFIVAHHARRSASRGGPDRSTWLYDEARSRARCPFGPSTTSIVRLDGPDLPSLRGHPAQITQEFGGRTGVTPFRNAGVMWNREVWTRTVTPDYRRRSAARSATSSCPTTRCRESFFIPDEQLPTWEYLKGAKREERVGRERPRATSTPRAAIAFPDPLDRPPGRSSPGRGARRRPGSSTSSDRATVGCAASPRRARAPQRLPRRLDGYRHARRPPRLHDGQRLGGWGRRAGR